MVRDPAEPPAPPRRTRAEQRAATRLALLDATTACLMEEGYAALTTRRVAERAGVAQSTFMHYFPSRDEYLLEAITHLARRLVESATEAIDLRAMMLPELRERVLDQAWRSFTSSEAMAASQLWMAVWTEPELAAILRELEQRLGSILAISASTLFPQLTGDTRFPAIIDAAIAMIRGLIIEIPIWGLDVVMARWEAIKPVLLEAAEQLLD